MPPPVILDPSAIDLTHVLADRSLIEQFNPQRHEFALLDAVVHIDKQAAVYAGFHDITSDDWWVRAHIPGRPLFPGVLMIEVAAQLSSFVYRHAFGGESFLGFTGVDDVKFRGTVSPPARFLILGRPIELKRRRTICHTQGFVDGQMVFEGTITGMPV